MNDKVDLTQNRDFRKKSSFKIPKNIVSKMNYPWVFKNTVRVNENSNRELFFTGNKQERKYKKESKDYEEGIECECCGMDLSKKKWLNNNYRLCPKCNSRLDSRNTSNKPWLKFLL